MNERKRVLYTGDVEQAAEHVVAQLPRKFKAISPVPRGGIPAAFAIARAWERVHGSIEIISPLVPVSGHEDRVLVVDDIWDSGKTLTPYLEAGYTCAVLVAKGRSWTCVPDGLISGDSSFTSQHWVVFPWESDAEQQGPADAVRRLLQYIGEDPDAPHLQETPRRFLSWLDEFRADREPDFHATKFQVGYSGMVIVRAIPFTSLCAHHLLPFSGKATVAYIPPVGVGTPQPQATVLGLSKLARIVQHHAKRLQSQEEMTRQILGAIRDAAVTPDAAVILSAEHSCMNFRGPRVPGSETITSEVSGAFWTKPEARAEFMALAHASA